MSVRAVALLDNAVAGLTGALSALTSSASTGAGDATPPDGAGAVAPISNALALTTSSPASAGASADLLAAVVPPTWQGRLAGALIASIFETDASGIPRTDVNGNRLLRPDIDPVALQIAIGVARAEAGVADPTANAADAVARMLVEMLGSSELTGTEAAALETAVRKSVIDDPEVLDGFATLQLGIVKSGGATLTPYQEGVFLQKFKELLPAQTIDEARANALLAAQAAPANPPGTNPDGQVNRGDFNFRNALFVLSPSGYRSDPVYVDSQGNSFQDFIRNGGNDDNPYSMEISSYTLINGELSEGGASTTLDDGSYATVNFDEKGFSVRLPNGERYSDTGWYDDITDPVSAYRGVASPSDPLSIYRFKALTEGTAPPAMPSAPPATTPPATPPALPEPQTPPGVEPGNGESFAGAIYPADSASEAGRIASTLLQGQPASSYALVMRDKDTAKYWVTGPYADTVTTASVEARFPGNYERAGMVGGARSAPTAPDGPPELGADNEKSSNFRRRQVSSYFDGLRVANSMVSGAAYGDFADVTQHRVTGDIVVFGPFYARNPDNEDMISRLIRPEFEIIQRVYNARDELPQPVPRILFPDSGRFDAKLYPAINSIDAGIIGMMLMRSVMDGTDNNYAVTLRDRITGRYYVDGPFDITEIPANSSERDYPPLFEVMYIQTMPPIPYIPRWLPPDIQTYE
jgi:hypothetical protein